MNNHDDSTDIINSVIRDIAAWDIKRDGYDPIDEGMIDDWHFARLTLHQRAVEIPNPS